MFRSLLPRSLSLRYPIRRATAIPLLIKKPEAIRFYSGFPALTRDVAKERVLELLEGYDKIGEGKEIKEDASYIQDLGLDSLDVVEVIMELEHEFNIQIPDSEADSLKTVGQTIDYVMKQPDAC